MVVPMRMLDPIHMVNHIQMVDPTPMVDPIHLVDPLCIVGPRESFTWETPYPIRPMSFAYQLHYALPSTPVYRAISSCFKY